MNLTLKQNGSTIQILPEINGDYLSLENVATEILRRDSLYIIEKIELFLDGELLEVPDCLTQLRAKVDNAIIFEESSILEFNKTRINHIFFEKMKEYKDAKINHSKMLENNKQEYLSLKENSNLKVSDVIKPFCGQVIGINALDVSNIEKAKLVEVQYDHFVVEVGNVLVHIPYSQIIKITNIPNENMSVGLFGIGGKFQLIIKVFDFVIYKGAVGVGIQMPI